MINSNIITSQFNRTKAALAIKVDQGGSQVVKGCKLVANVTGFVLRKAIRAPLLLKNIFNDKDSIKNSSSLTQQQVIVDPLKGPNPLIEDFSQSLKATVIFYKKLASKSGDLVEKTVNQAGCLVEKTINQNPSVESLPSLDQVGFEKLIDSSLRVTQKFFPKEFLTLTAREESEKKIIRKIGPLLACLQHFEIPHVLSKSFTPSDIDSMTEQLKLIDTAIRAFIIKEVDLSNEDVCCILIDALDSVGELQSLLEKYQKEVSRPIDERDRIFAKNTIENNPLVTKVVSPTVIALGSVVTPFITIDCVSYIASNAINLLTNVAHVFQASASLMPVLQNATITTASYALVTVNYTNEEEQEGYSRYIINTLANQVFMCAFAYVGARMCGSKTKIKEFVEQRISSVLAYRTCNYSLDYLGISFWPNKTVSSIVSSCTSRMLDLFTENDSF